MNAIGTGSPPPILTTVSGKHIDILDPSPKDFCLRDIICALSKEPRFGCQIFKDYKVAQHSCLVAKLMIENGHSCIEAMIGLFHDAAEAYLKDLPTPLKRLFPEYKEIETRFLKAIFSALDYLYYDEYVLNHVVPFYDSMALKIEKENLTDYEEDWIHLALFKDMPIPILIPMNSDMAKDTFSKMYYYLSTYNFDKCKDLDIGVDYIPRREDFLYEIS